MKFEDWLASNEDNFGSPYEAMFASKVIKHVDGLDYRYLKTQYLFKDVDHRTRYCDFVLDDGEIKIAIEIDGYDKTNRNQGMSHDEFVDWQRRQASLTAQGWRVLRFANRDVRDHPNKCKKLFDYLLRELNSQKSYHSQLKEKISSLNKKLSELNSNSVASAESISLKKEIQHLNEKLKYAISAKPLTDKDKEEVSHLENELNYAKKEMDVMKTTIWAFAIILASIIASATYIFTRQNENSTTQFENNNIENVEEHSRSSITLNQTEAATTAKKTNDYSTTISTPHSNAPSRPATQEPQQDATAPSCDTPTNWTQAKNFVGKTMAFSGTVAEFTYLPEVNGQPTWINIGGAYPNKNRLSIVVWGSDRNNFGKALSTNLEGKRICIIGTVNMRNNTPQINIKYPRELRFQ